MHLPPLNTEEVHPATLALRYNQCQRYTLYPALVQNIGGYSRFRRVLYVRTESHRMMPKPSTCNTHCPDIDHSPITRCHVVYPQRNGQSQHHGTRQTVARLNIYTIINMMRKRLHYREPVYLGTPDPSSTPRRVRGFKRPSRLASGTRLAPRYRGWIYTQASVDAREINFSCYSGSRDFNGENRILPREKKCICGASNELFFC